MAALQIDEAQFGSLIMALFLTSCIVQLFIGPAVDRFGYKPLAVLASWYERQHLHAAFATTFGTPSSRASSSARAMALNTGATPHPCALRRQDPARPATSGNAFFGLGYCRALLFTLFHAEDGMSYAVSLSAFAS